MVKRPGDRVHLIVLLQLLLFASPVSGGAFYAGMAGVRPVGLPASGCSRGYLALGMVFLQSRDEGVSPVRNPGLDTHDMTVVGIAHHLDMLAFGIDDGVATARVAH